VRAQDYASAVNADKTSDNTSNNTNNVGSIDAGSVAGTIMPGGGIDFNNPGNRNQGDLSRINQADTNNIVAGAVNSSVSFNSNTALTVPASSDSTLANVTVDSSGGFVILSGLITLGSGALTLYLYKGSNILTHNVGAAAAGNIPSTVSDVFVDTSPDPSQPYSLHAVNISPSTGAVVQSARLVADHRKV